jgi:hypothetical protein
MENKIIICTLSTEEKCDYRTYDRTCSLKSKSKFVVQNCPYQTWEKHSPDYKEPEPQETVAQQKEEIF